MSLSVCLDTRISLFLPKGAKRGMYGLSHVLPAEPMMSEPFIISIHIPKTAGTTVADVFSRCFNRRVLFDYETYDKPQIVNREVRNNVDFIRSYFDVIHGHFYAWKYLDVFPDAKFIATIRHPVERVISQYLHELNEDSSNRRRYVPTFSGSRFERL
jgi:hypothetical protein